MIASYGSHCGHGARSTCALQFPTPSNGVIATRDISGNVPEPVLVVPDDEDKTMYRVIVARDLDLDTGSGVATQYVWPDYAPNHVSPHITSHALHTLIYGDMWFMVQSGHTNR
ncbi:hypothetical protein BC629DRAFT_1434554 [Irpex lacteus]|nr:hypothetical protein BC629DRAFT_1434554 [Irpex lacteus]